MASLRDVPAHMLTGSVGSDSLPVKCTTLARCLSPTEAALTLLESSLLPDIDPVSEVSCCRHTANAWMQHSSRAAVLRIVWQCNIHACACLRQATQHHTRAAVGALCR